MREKKRAYDLLTFYIHSIHNKLDKSLDMPTVTRTFCLYRRTFVSIRILIQAPTLSNLIFYVTASDRRSTIFQEEKAVS